ncbi:hypothetical protein WJX72_004213 [[Myrmecia] bisecta]|uniref:Uncharacterized protein n=1 Tax=[Myrmecia] bisecta TaxID=41462 RepID=A0AAW1PG02_9CHLO
MLRLASHTLRRASNYTTSTRTAAEAVRETGAAATEEGPKSKLYRILQTLKAPTSSQQIWELAEKEGLKSKRFTKEMLAQMKKGGWVATKPIGVVGKRKHTFGYILTTKIKPPSAGLSRPAAEEQTPAQGQQQQQQEAAGGKEAPAGGIFSRLAKGFSS